MILSYCCALRSEDLHTKVGCCAFRADNSIVSLGYNGAPPGVKIDWTDRDAKNKRVTHAEISCLRYAKPGEVSYLTVTTHPCVHCLPVIASYGIKTVYFGEEYHRDAEDATRIAAEFGIEMIKI